MFGKAYMRYSIKKPCSVSGRDISSCVSKTLKAKNSFALQLCQATKKLQYL